MKYKILGVIFLVIIAAAVVGGVYYWQNPKPKKQPVPITQDETANWKTYTNDLNGFEFKYPNDWSLTNFDAYVSLNSPENEKIFQQIQDGKMYGEGYMEDIIFTDIGDIKKEPENTANRLNAKTLAEFVNKDPLISEVKQVSFASVPAFEMVRGGFCAYYTIMIDKNNEIYQIMFCNVERKDKLTPTEKQILSTFKFTDSNSATSGTGTLAGHVTIGPFCPVERIGVPCPAPPNAYSSTHIEVSDQKVDLDSSGNYSVQL